MMTPRTLAAAAILATATLVVAQGTSDRPARMAPEFEMPDMSPEGQQKMMADYMELMSPGEHHDWKTTTEMWMEGRGAGGESMTEHGKASFEMDFGDRYLRQTYQGTMMGMPYTGEGMLGYDNHAGVYQNTWISTMSTAMLISEGHAHQDGKGMTLYGTMDEPTMNMNRKMVVYVTRVVDEDTFTFEIRDPHIGGEDNTVVELTYERVE